MCFSFLYICVLFVICCSKILIVGVYLVINGVPTILCFISVIWNNCLKGLVKIFFCFLVQMGTRNNWIFQKSVNFDPCAVANLLEVLEGINFGFKVCISFHVGMFIIFDSAPESIKRSISRSGE